MTLRRQIYIEQEATLHIRVPSYMKAWLIEMADTIPDRNMSDFVRDGLRLLMDEYGYDVEQDEVGAITVTPPKGEGA